MHFKAKRILKKSKMNWRD